VEDAMAMWTAVSSTKFTWVEPTNAADADLVIVFQDINPKDGRPYNADNSVNRSYFRPTRWDEDDVEESQAMLKSRKLTGWASLDTQEETDDAYWLAIRPPIPHDICYRGIVTETTAGNPSTVPGKWPPLDRSKRTIVHELGHFFGLDHENIGLWCKFWVDVAGKKALLDAANELNINATMFDNASIMDSLRR
jgi:hypothetical protein